VCQVVLTLMHLTAPRWALFGRKDAQQLAIIESMVRDLAVPLEIVPVDIRRESDGLAMSSRNAYLSPEQRQQALALSRALQARQPVHPSHRRHGYEQHCHHRHEGHELLHRGPHGHLVDIGRRRRTGGQQILDTAGDGAVQECQSRRGQCPADEAPP